MQKIQAHQIMAELLYIDTLLDDSIVNGNVELANHYDAIQQSLAVQLDEYHGPTDYRLLEQLSI